MVAHRTPKNESHARTSRTLFRKDFARTYIPHTFQKGFRTHTHTCDRTSDVCMCARAFTTHTLLIRIPTTGYQ